MFLRSQAFGESLTTVPNQSVEAPRLNLRLLCSARREKCRQTCDDGPQWPKFSSYSSSQTLDEDRKERGKTKESGPWTVCRLCCQFAFINSRFLLGWPGLTPGIGAYALICFSLFSSIYFHFYFDWSWTNWLRSKNTAGIIVRLLKGWSSPLKLVICFINIQFFIPPVCVPVAHDKCAIHTQCSPPQKLDNTQNWSDLIYQDKSTAHALEYHNNVRMLKVSKHPKSNSSCHRMV